MELRDGGLADEYWKRYYDQDEIEDIIDATETTMIVSGNYPLHVRMMLQPEPAPTILMAHGMLVYGLIFGRLMLPLHRAGFNVIQFDLPGLGQSGGPRAGCTTKDIFRAWQDAVNFTHQRFGDPLFVMGVAEDGVTCYYANANDPRVRAMSVHTLFEYGDPGGVHWQGSPLMVKLKAAGLAVLSRLRPTLAIKGIHGIPWEDVFGAPDDKRLIETLEGDPLTLQQVEFRFTYSLIRKQPVPVPFEHCRTPVQIIASDRNAIWPYEMVARNFGKLGGPKELITLQGKPQWEANRDFHEMYTDHVVHWFDQHGAERRNQVAAAHQTG
jgi:alpha-beta hydrolase superfamily lysophospholipase